MSNKRYLEKHICNCGKLMEYDPGMERMERTRDNNYC